MDPAQPGPDDARHAASDTAAAPAAPATGDPVIDAALVSLDGALAGPLADHVAAGESLDRVLRQRLDDLGAS